VKIGPKLILGFLFITLSLVVLGYISIEVSQRELQKSIGDSSSALAISILGKIDRDIYYRIEDPQIFCTRLTVQEAVMVSNNEFDKIGNVQDFINKTDREWTSMPAEEITPFMRQLISSKLSDELRKRIEFYEKKYGYRVFGEIFITNKYGANAAQSGKTSDYNQADEGWWQKTKNNGLYISEVEYDESSGIYSIAIGIRINDANGTFIGVMKSVLNIEEAIDAVKEAKAASSYSSIALKLVDKKGKIIYDSEGIFKIFEDVSGEKFFQQMNNDRGYFINAAERGEKDEMFAYANSKGYRDFGGLGWVLVVEYEAEEIQHPIVELRNTLLIASVAAILLAVMLSFSIYRSISKPITKLISSLKEISHGNLDAKIDAKSKDEICELASAFNKMLQDLKKSRKEIEDYAKNLEKQVEDRTKNLESKIEELERFNKLAVGRELRMIELKKKIGELEKNQIKSEKTREESSKKR
jgi:HAMP domain-containing protein